MDNYTSLIDTKLISLVVADMIKKTDAFLIEQNKENIQQETEEVMKNLNGERE